MRGKEGKLTVKSRGQEPQPDRFTPSRKLRKIGKKAYDLFGLLT